jgi:hypothetical protein
MRTRLAILAVLGLSGLAAPAAFADDPPPITVPTPTVPVPQPDPGPVAKPKPKPAPRPTPSRPAASTSRPVTPTYTPRPATVTPHPQASRPVPKKKAAVKHKAKAKPKPKPVATKPAQQGVAGAQKTHVVPPVASQDTSSGANWPRTALFLVLASILGAIAVFRYRRVHPREVDVEVLQPRARLPLDPPPVLMPTVQASSALQEERPPEQLLADIAPAPAEQPPQVRPEPVVARPPFHEPALGEAAVTRQVFEEVALQTPGVHADYEAVTYPSDEICAVAIWHGYVKSRFYAGLTSGEQGIEYALAESEPIRLRGNGTPERTPAAERALEALVAKLVDSGWEVEPPANDDSWHALRFRRAAERVESSLA